MACLARDLIEPFALLRRVRLAEGPQAIRAEFRDAAGNLLALEHRVERDSTPPAGRLVAPPFARESPVAVRNEVDGAASMRFRVDDAPWSPDEPFAPGRAVAIESDGPHRIEGRFADAAGNEAVLAAPVALDRVVPRLRLEADPSGLRLLADDAGTGVDRMRVRIDGVWGEWEPFAPLKVLAPGWRGAVAEIRDRAGNQGEAELEPAPLSPPPDAGAWTAPILLGLWDNGFDFDESTSLGPRRITAGVMAMGEMRLRWRPSPLRSFSPISKQLRR